MAERRVYRGWSVDEVTAAYHVDALEALKRGYVPTSEQWADFYGAAILTVTYEHRPDEVADVRRMLLLSPTTQWLDDRIDQRGELKVLRRYRTVIVLTAEVIVVLVTLWLVLSWVSR